MGGCGHVGLPLAIALAEVGFDTCIYDIDRAACEMVRVGKMPFREEQVDQVLPNVIASGRLRVSSDAAVLGAAQFVICVVGTPVDEFHNPTDHHLFAALEEIRPCLRDGQVLVLRSTLFPQTSERVHRLFAERGPAVDVAFCPERVAQGRGYVEIKSLPQIISAFSDRGRAACRFLFAPFGVELIEVAPLEAELVKLFNNVWRYVSFAVANQFFTIANDYGLDFYRIHHALVHHYPRGADIPTAGLAAGPCLFKDNLQLSAFSSDRFLMGQTAMLVNEGLPLYLVQRLERVYDLGRMTVGMLGMSFKANCDDTRNSLAFKLRRILATRARRVVCSDAHVERAALVAASSQLRLDDVTDADALIRQCDLIIIGVPHREYRGLDYCGKPVIDIWNCLGKGAII